MHSDSFDLSLYFRRIGYSGPAAAADNSLARAPSRDAQRQLASQQLHQVTQRNNYRGYDATPAVTHNAVQ